jgi:hypothetical protein
MSDAQHKVNALWAAHGHALEAADFTPYIHIRSAVKRSGKTRLLEVNELIVYEPLLTGGITASALVRSVDKFHPAILLDEIDAIFNAHGDQAEALRGIINTGYARSGKYIMNVPVGNSWEPRKFSTFGPKMFAGIGKCLPSTVRDRCLLFDIKRRHQKKEPIERFPQSGRETQG